MGRSDKLSIDSSVMCPLVLNTNCDDRVRASAKSFSSTSRPMPLWSSPMPWQSSSIASVSSLKGISWFHIQIPRVPLPIGTLIPNPFMCPTIWFERKDLPVLYGPVTAMTAIFFLYIWSSSVMASELISSSSASLTMTKGIGWPLTFAVMLCSSYSWTYISSHELKRSSSFSKLSLGCILNNKMIVNYFNLNFCDIWDKHAAAPVSWKEMLSRRFLPTRGGMANGSSIKTERGTSSCGRWIIRRFLSTW